MLINSVFWKPQFQGGVLKSGGDVREKSGLSEHMYGDIGDMPAYFWKIRPRRRSAEPVKFLRKKGENSSNLQVSSRMTKFHLFAFSSCLQTFYRFLQDE